MSEQMLLMDVPATKTTARQRRVKKVVDFNLLAWGTADRAIMELEKDVARHWAQFERAYRNWHAQPVGQKPGDEPKPPKYECGLLAEAISNLERMR